MSQDGGRPPELQPSGRRQAAGGQLEIFTRRPPLHPCACAQPCSTLQKAGFASPSPTWWPRLVVPPAGRGCSEPSGHQPGSGLQPRSPAPEARSPFSSHAGPAVHPKNADALPGSFHWTLRFSPYSGSGWKRGAFRSDQPDPFARFPALVSSTSMSLGFKEASDIRDSHQGVCGHNCSWPHDPWRLSAKLVGTGDSEEGTALPFIAYFASYIHFLKPFCHLNICQLKVFYLGFCTEKPMSFYRVTHA